MYERIKPLLSNTTNDFKRKARSIGLKTELEATETSATDMPWAPKPNEKAL